MRKEYQRQVRKSNHKFEVVRGQELMVRVPLPLAEVWAEMQTQVIVPRGQPGHHALLHCSLQFSVLLQLTVKPVTPGPSAYLGVPTIARPEDRVHRHVHRLAMLWVVNGVLRLMLVLWLFGAGRYFTPPNFGPPRIWAWPFWHSQVWGSILLILALFGVAHLVLAWGLFERQPWARFLGIILGILALVRFPLGTALGVYTLWVLAPEASGREYQQLSQPGYLRQA